MIWASSRTSFSRPRVRFPDERWMIQRSGKRDYDIFECLPDELEVTPDNLHTVQSPRVSAPAHATRVSPQASTRTSVPTPEADENRPRVAPTRRTTASTQAMEKATASGHKPAS